MYGLTKFSALGLQLKLVIKGLGSDVEWELVDSFLILLVH